MNPSIAIKTTALAAIFMLLLDAIYLTSMNKVLVNQLTDIQHAPVRFRILGAVICYICLLSGLYYFILREHRPIFDAFLLGIVIYGVYESTNYAVFKNWKLEIVFMDTLLGGILMSLTTFFVYKIM